MTAGEATNWRGLLEASGALAHGHFRLSSGLHSPGYVQCALLLEEPARARQVGGALAALLAPHDPESVLAPALGGLIVGHETAAALGSLFRFTERRPGGAEMELRRGFSLSPGERVAVVEDVVTTGKSTRETIAVAEGLGARVVAVGSILDRSGGGDLFGVPLESLLALSFPTYAPEECPLCREGRPITHPGSRPCAG